jgi:hypothetical protein
MAAPNGARRALQARKRNKGWVLGAAHENRIANTRTARH